MAKSSNILSSVKPTSGYVLIEPEETAKQTTSGIYLPDSATGDKPQQGKVLSVGPDEITDKGLKKPCPAKIGDKVIYKKWGGNEVKVNGEEWTIVEQKDILAIVK